MVSDYELKELIKNNVSRSAVCRVVGKSINGTTMRWINKEIKRLGLDISHFESNGSRITRKYPLGKKQCCVCGKEYETSIGNKSEKLTCSRSCSNTRFRSGKNHPNYKKANEHLVRRSIYVKLCFDEYGWEKKCVLCGWDIAIDVHHIDGNHQNNSKENLIPLCSNHHRMGHMVKYKEEVSKKIIEVLEFRILGGNAG